MVDLKDQLRNPNYANSSAFARAYMTEAADRIAALEAQLAEALEALEPFALVAEHDIGEDETDGDAFRPMPKPFNHAPQITVGHLRAARRIISEAASRVRKGG